MEALYHKIESTGKGDYICKTPIIILMGCNVYRIKI